MPTHTFILNGKRVSVDCEDDVRLLRVLRDLLGVTGPKYGCGLDVCPGVYEPYQRQGVQPVLGVGLEDRGERRDHDDRGARRHRERAAAHQMQEAWLDHDVAQCGYCQPGQIMTAVALVKDAKAQGRQITDDDLDGIRNVCRCGTYTADSSGDRGRRSEDVSVAGGSPPTTAHP